MHRLATKNFSDTPANPDVTYSYDESFNSLLSMITNGTGRRTGMTDAAGTEAWSYDQMGRVVDNVRIMNGISMQFHYTYTLAGGLKSVTYPDGQRVDYDYNPAGQPVSASDSTATPPIYYALNALYTPHGVLASVQNGAILSTYFYNNRLQPCRISVRTPAVSAPTSCTSTPAGDVLDFTYRMPFQFTL